MFVIDLRNTTIRNYNFSSVGNKNVDTIHFYSNQKRYVDKSVYVKILSENYADKIAIDSEHVYIKDDMLVVEWTMGSVATLGRKLQVQLQFEDTANNKISQSMIVNIALAPTLDINGSIEPIYPTILEHLQEQIDVLKAESVADIRGDCIGDTLTIDFYNANGVHLGTQVQISLPTADCYVGGAWDASTHIITLTKNDGRTTELDLSDIYDKIATVQTGLSAHTENKSNPHQVTKQQVGLGNVDNTSDIDKPVSTAQQQALGLKADKATTYTKTETNNLLDGKQDTIDSNNKLSSDLVDDVDATHKFATAEQLEQIETNRQNIATHEADENNPHNVTAQQIGVYTKTETNSLLGGKVDKESGKGLSTNDFDNDYKGQVEANTADRHAHSNKSLLDTYDQTNANIKSAVQQKHSHSNKSTLDQITAPFTTEEKSKLETIEADAQENVIEHIELNNEELIPVNKTISIDLSDYATNDNLETYAKSLEVSMNASTFVITFNLKDNGGRTLSNQTVDLPLETMATGLSYDNTQKSLNLSLKNGSTITVSIGAIIEGLVSETALATILLDYYDKDEVDAMVDAKVDKVTGKGLSTNDFTNADKDNLDANTSARHTHNNKTVLDGTTASYTTAEKTKLSGIEAGAQANLPNTVTDADYVHTDNNFTDEDKNNLDSNTSARHTHSNKAILDNTTASFTDSNYVHTDNNYTSAEKTKLASVSNGAQANTIEIVKVNGTALTPDSNKAVNVDISGKLDKSGGTMAGDVTFEQGNIVMREHAINLGFAGEECDVRSYDGDTYLEADGNIELICGGQNENATINLGKGFNGNKCQIDVGNLTAPRSVQFQDKSGTVALTSDVTAHTSNTNNPHNVTKAQVGLGNVDNTSDANKPVSTAQQTAINAVDNKLNASVHIEGGSDEITYVGDTVTKTSPYKNLKTGATGSRSEVIQLANDTHAGMMSHTDYQQIRENTARIENLEGQTTRLLYTASQNPTAQQIADFVDDYLETKGIVNPTDEDYAGIAVVIAGTYHIWHYYSNQTPNWKDDGLDTVSQFSNSVAGIIQGKNADGFVYAETDGTGSIVGWSSLKTRVSNLETADTTKGQQITALQNDKVDKVSGKGLSTNDFTTAYKNAVDANTNARHTHSNKTILDNTTASYTSSEASKLSGIASGAQVNVIETVKVNGTALTPTNKAVDITIPSQTNVKVLNTTNTTAQATDDDEAIGGSGTVNLHKVSKTGNYSDLNGKPSLSTVATSGSYNDLSNKPTIPTADSGLTNDRYVRFDTASQGLTNTQKSNARTNIGAGTSSFSGNYNDLTNKPTIPTVNNGTLTIQKNGTDVATFTANQSGNSTANISVPTKDSEITNDQYVRFDTASQGLTATQKSNARTNIGAGTSSFSGSYNDLSNKPNLATVATSGNYNDLSNKPTIPTDTNQKVKAGTVEFGNDDVVGFVGSGLVSVTGNATNKTITISANESHTGDVKTVTATSGSNIAIGGTTANPTVGVASGYSIPSTTAQTSWTNKYDKPSDGIPASDLKEKYVRYDTASQGLSDTEKQNARTNIGAGTSSFNGSYNNLTDKPNLATVATSGSYNDLSNKPTIPSDTNQKIKQGSVTFGSNDVVNFVGGGNITITGNTTSKTMTLGVASDYSIPSDAKQTEWDGKQSKIDASNKLSSDLVDDTNNAHKFVTSTDKTTWNNKQDKINTTNKLSADYVDDTGTTHKFVSASDKTNWDGKQDALQFDTTPTSGSANPVTSGGVYTALASKQATINANNKLSSDLVDDTNHTNKFVTSAEKTTWGNKQDAISTTSKLSADLVDDTNSNNKFVTATDKTNWNAKYNKPSTGIPVTDLADTCVKTVQGRSPYNTSGNVDLSGIGIPSSIYITNGSDNNLVLSVGSWNADVTAPASYVGNLYMGYHYYDSNLNQDSELYVGCGNLYLIVKEWSSGSVGYGSHTLRLYGNEEILNVSFDEYIQGATSSATLNIKTGSQNFTVNDQRLAFPVYEHNIRINQSGLAIQVMFLNNTSTQINTLALLKSFLAVSSGTTYHFATGFYYNGGNKSVIGFSRYSGYASSNNTFELLYVAMTSSATVSNGTVTLSSSTTISDFVRRIN